MTNRTNSLPDILTIFLLTFAIFIAIPHSTMFAETYTFSNVTGNHRISAAFTAENQPPMADAVPDQTVQESQTVNLSGLNSVDLDDGIAAFQWRQIQGDPVTLNFYNEPETTFTTPNVDLNGAALVFEL